MAASKSGTTKRCRQRRSVRKRSAVGSAPQVLGGLVVVERSDAAEEAGRPVGIPVVVIRTTETPAAGQLKARLQRCQPTTVDGIGNRTDRNRAGRRRPALGHVERAPEGSGGSDDIFRCANTISTFHLDVVTRPEGNILDLQR